MITPLPPQLRPDHPSIVASHARWQEAMGHIRRAMTAALHPVPAAADTRSVCQVAADETRLWREQQQAIDIVSERGEPG